MIILWQAIILLFGSEHRICTRNCLSLSAEETLLLTMAQNGNVDAKQFYGYLFEADKKPTKVLDALLRGIAIYIVSCDRAGKAMRHHRERHESWLDSRRARR
jgi:hypothetical protein